MPKGTTSYVRPKPLIAGIGGGTGAGKTALIRLLTDRFRDMSLLDLDSYYLDRSSTQPKDRRATNYDEPSAFDVGLLLDHLCALRGGRMVLKPRYCYESHTRIGVDTVFPTPLVVVEGIFALWWEEVRALLDLKVFVDAPPDLRLLRRIQRDTRERGRTLDSILTQYLETVRPMHERYVERTRMHADLVIENVTSVERSAEPLVAAIAARIGVPPSGF